jgi:hypothetical protein
VLLRHLDEQWVVNKGERVRRNDQTTRAASLDHLVGELLEL